MESVIEIDGKRYHKPNMANLRGRRGREIFEAIMNQPKPDWDKLEREAAELEARIIAEHEARGE